VGHCYSPGRPRFEYISNSNYFKTLQTLTDPKTVFPSSKNLKQNMGFKSQKGEQLSP
jgi:hypothetical protein